MIATCNSCEGYALNPHVTLLHLDAEKALFSLYGKIKRLKGDFSFLHNFEETRATLPAGLVQALVRNQILLPPVRAKLSTDRTFVIWGEGVLAEICRNVFAENGCAAKMVPFTRFTEQEADFAEKNNECAYLFCPSQASMSELLAANRFCVSNSLTFAYCYFDGVSIVLGPKVTPESPCLECLFTWKNKVILRNAGAELSKADLGKVQTAYAYHSALPEPAQRAANLLVSHLMEADSAEFSLARKQVHIPLLPELSFSETRFEGISLCEACGGRLSRKYYTEPELFRGEADGAFALVSRPAAHKENGYRVLETSAAKQMIDSALGAAGAHSITELKTGSLDDLLPTYVATLQARGKEYNGFGKGVTHAQAYLSAAFEAIERLCSEPLGTLAVLNAPWKEVRDVALNVENKIGKIFFHRHVDAFSEEASIDWVWGNSLVTRRPLLTPASMVYIGPSRFSGRFYIPSTGGIAAGTTFEDALLQGLLELIEHDAWMIWQANAIPGPRVDPAGAGPEILRIINGFEEKGYKVIIRYLATELGIPVFRVWLIQPGSFEVYAAQGFGCHLNKEIALLRALTEAKIGMPQKLYKKAEITKFMSRGNRDILDSRHSFFYLHHFVKTDMRDDLPSLSFHEIEDRSGNDIVRDIETIVSLLQANIPDIEIVAVNLTDERFAVPVVRVLATGLQQLSQPIQSVQNRLFSVPPKLYRGERAKTYNELFTGRFQF